MEDAASFEVVGLVAGDGARYEREVGAVVDAGAALGGGRDVTNAPPFSAYGFDEHASTWESPEPDANITATNWIWSAGDKIKRWDRTAYFVDRTLDFLKRHKGQPCYVNLWPDDVHTPWVAEGTDLNKKRYPENEATFKAVHLVWFAFYIIAIDFPKMAQLEAATDLAERSEGSFESELACEQA